MSMGYEYVTNGLDMRYPWPITGKSRAFQPAIVLED